MVDENEHSVRVNAWMERAAKGLPPARQVQAFEQAFDALWQRAHQTLGEVTLTAIVDRVLYNAAESFPFLSGIKVEPIGFRWQELRETSRGLQGEQLAEGIRFVLVEFLTVIGNLTADILTPSLHAELSKLAKKPKREPRSPGRKASEDANS